MHNGMAAPKVMKLLTLNGPRFLPETASPFVQYSPKFDSRASQAVAQPAGFSDGNCSAASSELLLTVSRLHAHARCRQDLSLPFSAVAVAGNRLTAVSYWALIIYL
jgi:hypothetical protein